MKLHFFACHFSLRRCLKETYSNQCSYVAYGNIKLMQPASYKNDWWAYLGWLHTAKGTASLVVIAQKLHFQPLIFPMASLEEKKWQINHSFEWKHLGCTLHFHLWAQRGGNYWHCVSVPAFIQLHIPSTVYEALVPIYEGKTFLKHIHRWLSNGEISV